MSDWRSGWWKSSLVQGGFVLAVACVLLSGAVFPVSAAALSFFYSAVFLGALVLAWRFHSGRTFAAILLVLLAHRAIDFFSAGHISRSGPGHAALEVVSLFVALNFIGLAAGGDFGFTIPAVGPRLGILFFESVFVAVLCRPTPNWGSDLFQAGWFPQSWFSWTRLSQVSWLALALAWAFLVVHAATSRRQIDAGLAWALAAMAAAFSGGGVGHTAEVYFAAAGLLLLLSVVEQSYRMAYHDELTGMPGRRAFNDACASLVSPYAVAVVDIDHFKQFNDTYGHDTGDEVLRMVAAKLESETGGGQAFRVGGEEFTILFAGKSVEESAPHLEDTRRAVECATFRMRGADRRLEARGPERRRSGRRGAGPERPTDPSELKVTVSLGAAQSREGLSVAEVLEQADLALYRAKRSGRNRLEIGGKGREARPRRMRAKKASAKSA